MIAFFYQLDLAQILVIIQFRCNGLQYHSGARLARAKVIINQKSMSLTILPDNFPGCVVKRNKMYCLKFRKIH